MKKFKDISIIVKFGLILIFLIILFVLNFAGIRYLNAKKDVDEYFINQVEKNKMIINRIGFLAEMVAHGKIERKLDLENTLEEFDEVLYFLKEGGEVKELKQTITIKENPRITNILDSLNRIWQPYRANVEIILNERITYNTSSKTSVLSDNSIAALNVIENTTRRIVTVNDLLISEYEQQRNENLRLIRIFLWLVMLLSFVVALISVLIINRFIVQPVRMISQKADAIAHGNESEKIKIKTQDELGKIATSINDLSDKLIDVASFVTEVGKGIFDTTLHSVSEDDFMGKALRNMRDNFLEKATEEEKRREEDRQRNWIAAGLAKFAEILRNEGENLEKLADHILSNLTKYMEINQAGLFVMTEGEADEVHLELVAAYAYNRKKYIKRSVNMGEGLVGTCALEKETIYRSEIPEDYIQITSGLGGSNPRYLLLTPLKLNEEVYGVIELASFETLEPYEIEFVENLGESIASTLSAVRINTRTARLLEQSQEQAEELHSQEEEMRQNIEELQATQEEMSKKEIEMTGLFDAINHSVGMYELSLDGSFIKANNLFLLYINLNEDDLLGKNHYGLVQGNFKDGTEYETFWNELLVGKHYRKDHVFKINDQDINIHESYTPVKNPDGHITKVLVLVNKDSKDVSKGKTKGIPQAEFKEKEQELKKALEEVEKLQQQLKEDQKKYNDSLAQLRQENEQLMASEEKTTKTVKPEEKPEEPAKEKPAPAPAIQEESKLLEWDDKKFKFDIAEIDDQHQNLLNIINTLYQAVNENKSRKQLQSIIKELIDYAQYHFGTEERYFDEFEYKEKDEHIKEHQVYTKKITKLLKDVGSNKSKVSFDMMNFIGEWLENHISKADKKYVSLFKLKGLE